MNFDEAASMVQTSSPLVRTKMLDFKETVLGQHAEHSTRRALAQAAIESLEHGISELAKLGHSVHMELGPAQHAAQEYPKHLVHSEPPFELQVNSSEEESKARAEGWKMLGESEAAKLQEPQQEAQPASSDSTIGLGQSDPNAPPSQSVSV
jgi:hypothetical protein